MSERVIGRKAMGLQMKEIVSDIFYLSLKRQEETNKCYIFSPSLYKFKKRFLLKVCVVIMTSGST